MIKHLLLAAATLSLATAANGQENTSSPAPQPALSPNAIVDAAAPGEWITIPAEDLLVMTLAPDRDGNSRSVIIQLMPAPFSTGWVQNIRTFARAKWYDSISVNRVQDNYVVQWGDPNYDNPEAEGEAKALPDGLKVMEESQYKLRQPFAMSEAAFSAATKQAGTNAVAEFLGPLFRPDPYGGGSTIIAGWPIGVDADEMWPVHCYGMIGVGRGYSPDTGSGAELYTVIGHAPRHLDRNIALVGRIVEGMEHLSSLPRGSGALGFYTADEFDKRTPIQSVRVASDLPAADQPAFEYLATEGETFARYADARANRRDPFFIVPAGGADICNIPVPVRRTPNG
ncbi:peptidylprolyl isomerase [Altererythrobacter sp. RZ02]|uniref:Peptidylprolyl isomerase n=1 Tax=Pontixanthobacter rizhaonensis TaxID=2730337 RepID=A0A848QND9_9SPHN|nr:peptidylprolyl isomerase [Pontixanthobacter rizhaonensis]NMW32137.1 peptidylprolyl isomerase [Pontixanthobacter rizhaonensis]